LYVQEKYESNFSLAVAQMEVPVLDGLKVAENSTSLISMGNTILRPIPYSEHGRSG